MNKGIGKQRPSSQWREQYDNGSICACCVMNGWDNLTSLVFTFQIIVKLMAFV